MRILYLSPSEPYPGTHAGFTHVHNILSHLTQEGIRAVLLAGKPETGIKMPHIKGVEVRHILASVPLFRNLSTLSVAIDVLGNKDFVLIHERMETVGGVGTLLASFRHLPHILEVNDPFLELNSPAIFRSSLRLLKSLQFSGADAIITQTPQIRRAIHDIHPKKEVFVIPNGADPDAFPVRELPDNSRIGFLGSFMPWHGVHHLIEAFRIVAAELKDAELLLMGNPGHMSRYILQKIRSYGLQSRIRLTGAVPSHTIPGLLSSCAILIAPFAPELDPVRRKYYRRFGFWWSPLKIFEYMASGRPVVASGVGMIPDYIKSAGVIFNAGDIQGLARRIIELLTDRERMKRLGMAGRERVVKIYNWRRMAKLTARVYHHVLESKD